ncbi:iron ABC transporter permease [Oceanobacillus sp. FSL K6-2867]|uniref:FecCD family ABC transporter permease n=1 Tax=Oceanobacillus sp. FSL K6-2867 TaxID=2954748 RepID=UPI0030DADBA0
MEEKINKEDSVYIGINKKRVIVTSISVALLCVAALVDLSYGSSRIGIDEVINALLSGPSAQTVNRIVIWDVRLPMTLTCIFVGGCLGLAGLQMQTITGNSLASPYTLGITASANFGAAVAVTTGFSIGGFLWMGTSFLAFVFAALVSMSIFFMGKLKGMSTGTLILTGIVMNFFFSALQQILQYRASAEVAQIIMSWTFGNLARSTWIGVGVNVLVLVVCAIVLLRLSWKLTALSAGEERAQSLGINVERLRFFVFMVSSALIAASVAFIGTVAFVGLVVPHCARLILGGDQRYLLPVTVLFGGILLLLASITSKLLSVGSILPVGIVTSLVGVPFLFILLLKMRR